MAEFIPLTNTVRVAVNATLVSQKIASIFHVYKSTAWSEGDMTTLANLFKDWVEDDLIPLQPTDYVFTSIVVVDQTTENSPGLEILPASPVAGDGGQTSLPGNVTFTVKWLTQYRGRSYRGRTYHPGVRLGLVIGNALSSAAISAYTVVYGNLKTDIETAGYSLVVASRYADNAPRTTGVTTEITGLVIEGNLDSQRRRLNTRGD